MISNKECNYEEYNEQLCGGNDSGIYENAQGSIIDLKILNELIMDME